MTKPKPLLTIKRKCKCNCHDNKEMTFVHSEENCKCSRTGTQETEIYALRDFEKCKMGFIGQHPKYCADGCNGTGYKIPFKDYEIKRVSEITEEEAKLMLKEIYNFNAYHKINLNCLKMWLNLKHNLKEDDKVVVRGIK